MNQFMLCPYFCIYFYGIKQVYTLKHRPSIHVHLF